MESGCLAISLRCRRCAWIVNEEQCRSDVNCCNQAWLLKNSFNLKSQKQNCVRKRFKRFSNFKAFHVTRILTISVEIGVFQQPQASTLMDSWSMREMGIFTVELQSITDQPREERESSTNIGHPVAIAPPG